MLRYAHGHRVLNGTSVKILKLVCRREVDTGGPDEARDAKVRTRNTWVA